MQNAAIKKAFDQMTAAEQAGLLVDLMDRAHGNDGEDVAYEAAKAVGVFYDYVIAEGDPDAALYARADYLYECVRDARMERELAA